jgi:beta-xylosidase
MMKSLYSKLAKTIFIAALVSVSTIAAAQQKETSGNPLFKGWYADPEAKIFDKTYWIYPTYSAKYDEQIFMDAFSSPDLVHWTKHEHVIDSSSIKWLKRALWAPAVTKKDGKYYLFFGANDIHDDLKETGGIGVAVADNPGGPFKDYLGKPLIGKIYNKAQPIDQFVYKDDDGQYYMIYGGWGQCNIVKLNNDFTGLIPFKDGETYKRITPKDYVEGPVMFKRKGKYYLMWSEGGWTGPDYRVAYAIGSTPIGPFKRIATILKQDINIATGAGHHSVINIPGTDEWYIVYHRRPLGETDGNHRVTCIDKMYFDAKGFIQPVKITKEGVSARVIK